MIFFANLDFFVTPPDGCGHLSREGDRLRRFPFFDLGRSLLRAAFLPIFLRLSSSGGEPRQDARLNEPASCVRTRRRELPGVQARRETLC
jgi:hypothetical protein